jgi:hypothetical protein
MNRVCRRRTVGKTRWGTYVGAVDVSLPHAPQSRAIAWLAPRRRLEPPVVGSRASARVAVRMTELPCAVSRSDPARSASADGLV